MAEKTGISWTRSTFNPWIGCSRVGPGCDHCYAEALDRRHKFGGGVHWGAGVPRYRTSEKYWAEPLKWNKLAPESEFAGRRGFWPVFCASLADVFDNEVPSEWRTDLWNLIDATPNLSWLLVTKRIANVHRMVPIHWYHEKYFPPNVRIMVTVVDQAEADRDVPRLLQLPCKNGVSYEPALGPVNWLSMKGRYGQSSFNKYALDLLDWIVVGGESNQSGHEGRLFDIGWAKSTIAQCRDAGVPVFVKQLGPLLYKVLPHPTDPEMVLVRADLMKNRAGSDPSEWPDELRVREFPE